MPLRDAVAQRRSIGRSRAAPRATMVADRRSVPMARLELVLSRKLYGKTTYLPAVLARAWRLPPPLSQSSTLPSRDTLKQGRNVLMRPTCGR
ncbi:MAG: hypothetical protein QM820_10505 [Minicystis sp.]